MSPNTPYFKMASSYVILLSLWYLALDASKSKSNTVKGTHMGKFVYSEWSAAI